MSGQYQNMEETLWNYIDKTLNEKEMSAITQLIQSNQEWQLKYHELLEAHLLMQNHIELEQPSMRFTQNVMEEISKLYIAPAAKNYINKNIIKGIFIFFVAMMVGLLGYAFGQVDWSQPGSATPSTWSLGNFDWSKIFNSTYMNIFIMINIVLGLMLLDMYLTSLKRKANP